MYASPRMNVGLSKMLLVSAMFLVSRMNVQLIDKPKVGERFNQIKMNFEREAKDLKHNVRGPNSYNAVDVNTVLERTKGSTMDSIPVDDEPLREYVARKFPEPVDESVVSLSGSDVEQKFNGLRSLLGKLSRLDSFRLNLTINTEPSRARFLLVFHGKTNASTTTNSTITNIYRGEYEYRIERSGYKPVHEAINFIDRAGSVLECELQLESASERALPCTFR